MIISTGSNSRPMEWYVSYCILWFPLYVSFSEKKQLLVFETSEFFQSFYSKLIFEIKTHWEGIASYSAVFISRHSALIPKPSQMEEKHKCDTDS